MGINIIELYNALLKPIKSLGVDNNNSATLYTRLLLPSPIPKLQLVDYYKPSSSLAPLEVNLAPIEVNLAPIEVN